MRKALQLAERGRGLTSPNPMVGAIIVDPDGVIIGRGAHEFAGGPHAEVHALNAAGTRARGATLYCTLEPCSHTGRTGPCAPLVVAAGMVRVVVATEDPNPLVAGRGLQLLRGSGIDVVAGVLAGEAERLNRPFFTFIRHGRPFVTMKIALSADGKIAGAAGERTSLTGEAANRQVHRDRAEADAVAIGSGTALTDDPLLTARGAYRSRPLTRVIFDARLRTPASARIFGTLDAGPVIIMGNPETERTHPGRAAALRASGATVECPSGGLNGALAALAARQITSLIVEGGTALHHAFWNAGAVDRVQIYRSPRILGERGVAWLPFDVMGSPLVAERSSRMIGGDTLFEAYVHRTD